MRKRCIRKKWALVDPIAHAIEGASITAPDKLDKLLLRELASLDALAHGKGGLQEWSDMSAVLNLAETMARQGVGIEALPACADAESALIEAATRFQATRRMGLSGRGIQALRDVIEYHHLQRQSISRSEYDRHIQLMTAHVKSGHVTVDLNESIGPMLRQISPDR